MNHLLPRRSLLETLGPALLVLDSVARFGGFELPGVDGHLDFGDFLGCTLGVDALGSMRKVAGRNGPRGSRGNRPGRGGRGGEVSSENGRYDGRAKNMTMKGCLRHH